MDIQSVLNMRIFLKKQHNLKKKDDKSDSEKKGGIRRGNAIISNKIIIHPSFNETIRELSERKIKLPEAGTQEDWDFSLSSEFITRIFRAIHQESINHQEKIMNEE